MKNGVNMYYKKHIFFCSNNKSNAAGCGDVVGERGFAFAKMYLQSIDQWGEGKIRASKSGCLGRCVEAPVCVVYPDGVWYRYVDDEDLREIIVEHLLSDRVVERLLI